jgi:hypothetical protein
MSALVLANPCADAAEYAGENIVFLVHTIGLVVFSFGDMFNVQRDIGPGWTSFLAGN